MKNILLILPLLAGCGSMLSDSTPIRTEDGSKVYSIMSLYGGESGSREQAAKSLDIEARNLCMSGYTLMSEETRPMIDADGGVRSSRLIWEVKCDKKPEETS